MKRLFTILICIVSIIFVSSACMGQLDPFSSGVVFNNMEQFKPKRLESMGTQTENYIKSCMAIKPDPSTKPIVMVTPAMRIAMFMDPVMINNIQLKNNLLTLNVTYGGGCSAHEFTLYAFTALDESFPPISQLQLSHNGNNDRCKALITETITFDLKPFESTFSLLAPIIMSINAPVGENSFTEIKFPWYPDNTCSYAYRSHYFSEAMVYLNYYNTGSTPVAFPRMAIVVDPMIRFIVPFDFEKAITTELSWLLSNGILSGISDDKIDQIGKSFRSSQGQYWTHQDSLLGYNAFYTYTKNSTGSYTWGDPLVTKSDCGLNVKYELPSKEIEGSVSVNSSTINSQMRNRAFTVRMSGTNILLNLQKIPSSSARVDIVNSKGQKIVSFRPVSETKSVKNVLSKPLTQGVYQVVFKDDGLHQVQTMTVVN